MRHILEFNDYLGFESPQFKVVRWDFGSPEDETEYFRKHSHGDVDHFNVWVETPDGDEEKISVDYQMFLEHMRESIPNLQSYLSTSNFTDMKVIFDDLSDLGFDLGEQIQSWVDYNVTQDTIDAMKSGELESDDEDDDYDDEEFEDEFDDEGELEHDEEDHIDDDIFDDEDDDNEIDLDEE